MKTKIHQLLVALILLVGLQRAAAQFVDDPSSQTVYQGQLMIANQLDHGSNQVVDMTFTLFNTSSGDSPVTGPITNIAIAVNSNGLFSTTLNFGSSPFIGTTTNWLEIAVRTNGDGAFTTLSPRQLLASTPRAIYAFNAGTAAIAVSATNFSGVVSGDVSGTQGATVVSSVGGQTAVNVASGAIAANSATSSNVPNTIVKRDGSGNIAAGSLMLTFTGSPHVPVLPAFSATLDGNLYLPYPAYIYAGSNVVFSEEGNTSLGLHSNPIGGVNNVRLGVHSLDSGNTGSRNTAVGEYALFSNSTGHDDKADGYQALYSNTSGFNNTAEGSQALYSNTGGFNNTGIGVNALYFNTAGYYNTAAGVDALKRNTTGFYNTANGVEALAFNTTGYFNTASGDAALKFNTSGSNNTASGVSALGSNTNGSNNTADGFQALDSNTSGNNNTANGLDALYSNTTGSNNTASGVSALLSNTVGYHNTANGFEALKFNSTGSGNTANGHAALYSNTTGDANTASGNGALYQNSSGIYNTADGVDSLYLNTTGDNNTASGFAALYFNTTGSNNTALGYQAGLNLTTGDNNIYIGNPGVATESDTIRIGTVNNVNTNGPANTYIAGIYDTTIASGVPVVIDSSGHLGTITSSERFKQNIQSMADASDVLLSLRPVTYQYKPGLDPKGVRQFGLVAEEVDQIDPNLVVHDDRHGIYTVRYEAVNAMLLNEFLKQHRKVEDQSAEIARLKEKAARVDSLETRVSELEQMMQSLKVTK
jgi:hypothetical protein